MHQRVQDAVEVSHPVAAELLGLVRRRHDEHPSLGREEARPGRHVGIAVGDAVREHAVDPPFQHCEHREPPHRRARPSAAGARGWPAVKSRPESTGSNRSAQRSASASDQSPSSRAATARCAGAAANDDGSGWASTTRAVAAESSPIGHGARRDRTDPGSGAAPGRPHRSVTAIVAGPPVAQPMPGTITCQRSQQLADRVDRAEVDDARECRTARAGGVGVPRMSPRRPAHRRGHRRFTRRAPVSPRDRHNDDSGPGAAGADGDCHGPAGGYIGRDSDGHPACDRGGRHSKARHVRSDEVITKPRGARGAEAASPVRAEAEAGTEAPTAASTKAEAGTDATAGAIGRRRPRAHPEGDSVAPAAPAQLWVASVSRRLRSEEMLALAAVTSARPPAA